MSLRLGTIGVAVAAALALTAVAASTASAKGEYECEVEPCIATGSGSLVAETAGITTECTGVLQGTSVEATGSGGLGTVHSRECESSLGEITIQMNHCAFSPGNETEEGLASVTLECAEGNEVEVSVPSVGCTLSYAPQGPATSVHYTNVEKHVVAEGEGTAEYTASPVFLCALGGIPAEGTTTVAGESTATCYEDLGEPVEGTATTTAQETELGEEVACSIKE